VGFWSAAMNRRFETDKAAMNRRTPKISSGFK
jgi:hypothetical protein